MEMFPLDRRIHAHSRQGCIEEQPHSAREDSMPLEYQQLHAENAALQLHA